MRPLSVMTVIQVEITNACYLKCANCTRHVGHHRKPFFMELDQVRRAIDSLEGFPGRIGLMGGEPTMHPKFAEICKIYQEMIPDRRRREFWTSGWRWDEYKDVINETFDPDLIAFNDHTAPGGRHQPLLVAIDDVVDDKALMWNLIDNCWIQNQWSASITPKGAFFCEVAASVDYLFAGEGGWPVEKGWWKRVPADFKSQSERLCVKCSGALPLQRPSDGFGGRHGPTIDVISKGNVERLRALKSPKVARGHFEEYDKKYTMEDLQKNIEDWNPSHFRDFIAHRPEDVPRTGTDAD
ncbi:MAG: hypothetical protein OHK0024_05010 [Thalassobaculales bacterium]